MTVFIEVLLIAILAFLAMIVYAKYGREKDNGKNNDTRRRRSR